METLENRFEQNVERKVPNLFKSMQTLPTPNSSVLLRKVAGLAWGQRSADRSKCPASTGTVRHQPSRMRDSGSSAPKNVFRCKLAVQFLVKQ